MQTADGSSNRRTFCWTLGGAFIAPVTAMAQASRVRRIGVLDAGSPDEPEWYWKEAAPLRALGWIEGENLRVERRYAEWRPEAQQALAEELVHQKVELIVANDSATALAAKYATNSVPIIVNSAGDPVLVGLVASLARPGGNVTGVALAMPEVTAKELSQFRRAVPGLQRMDTCTTLETYSTAPIDLMSSTSANRSDSPRG
jgi:putative ABC transport system substrate-binding protein